MNWTSLSSRAAAGLVAGIAGFASYNHIVKVAREAGEVGEVALVLPLSIDGLIVVGTMAMIDDKRAGREPRLSARVALGFGVVATLAANIASARDTLTARLVAAVPAVAFLIAVEVLARTGRKVTVASEPAAVAPVEPAADDEPAPDPWQYAVPIGPLPAAGPVVVEPEPAPSLSDNVSDRKPSARKPPPTFRERVINAHNRTPDATDAELAARLKVSVKTIERYRPAKLSDNLSDSEQTTESINGHVPELVSAGGETR